MKKKNSKMKSENVVKTKSISLNKHLVSDRDIAIDFAEKVQKKFDRIVKASILFGSASTAKNNSKEGSDIDVALIVDDASIQWDLELIAWYREELGKLISAQKYSRELHINTVKLTTWWRDLMHGDAVVINMLRYGEALIDYGGFFNPLKSLLLRGEIRSTPEAVYAALQRAPWHMSRSRAAEASAIEGVYWAMVDSAHAALMTAGKVPPSPEHISDMLREEFVDKGLLKIGYVNGFKELFALFKSITHGQIANVKGAEIDEWQELGEKFLMEMTRLIDKMLDESGKKSSGEIM